MSTFLRVTSQDKNIYIWRELFYLAKCIEILEIMEFKIN
jgi:hypothetical protein